MSNFVVSARKYRPMRFDEVVGQEHISQTLKNAFKNNHLAHAFLFCGPRGVGKTTSARILAKVLNCENVTEDYEPCNQCNSCESFNGNASFNITELDAASNNSVEHIRALIEQVRFQPQKGRFKIYIIDEVHMLSQQAFNAFLKTLEEPPPYAKFILATTEKHKIIPTILSRCQIFDFKRISIPSMVGHLQNICKEENIQAEPDALHIIAQKADGALRDSLSIFDRIVSFSNDKITYSDVIENLNVLDYDYYFKLLDAMFSEDVSSVLLTFDKILRKGFDPSVFINGLAEHIRNILVGKDAKTLELLEVGEALKNQYTQQARIAPMSFLLAALNIGNDCDINYKMARNKRLHVEMALIKMTYLSRATKAVTQHVVVSSGAVEKKIEPIKTEKTASPTIQTKPAPTPEPVNNPPKAVPTPTIQSKVQLSNNETVKLKAFSIEAMEAEVAKEEQKEAITEKLAFTQENLTTLWNEFTETLELQSAKSIFKTAKYVLEAPNIKIKVSTSFAQSTMQQVKEFLPFLKERFSRKEIFFKFEVDAGAIKVEKPKITKPTKPGDIYRVMQGQNPLIRDLILKFSLKPEQR